MTEAADTERIEMRLLLEAIHARYGYDFRDYAEESMYRRLQGARSRMKVPHFGEMQHRTLTDPSFFSELLGQLTVQVTELFREPAQYLSFRDRVVPLLRTYPHLKIWHAGCASGEEAYSTAILLQEEGLNDRSQIYATDLSSPALESAREGIYLEDRVESFAKNYRLAGGRCQPEDYYSNAYGRIAIRDSLRRNLVFFQHDLVTDHGLGEMHVIFCRNVLMYFSTALARRVLTLFAETLSRGGFLCLGGSERIPNDLAGIFQDFAPGRIYRLRGLT
jgi:chemotaxis protein methyltransferase CheR